MRIRFGTTIQSIKEEENGLQVVFNDGTMSAFQLLFGADGVHSNVRELIFGPESQFARYLGYYVAAFHTPNHDYCIGRSLEIYEEPGRIAWFYPLDANCMDAVYIFRHDNVGYLPHEKRLAFVQEQFDGADWIAEDTLKKRFPPQSPFISMPWSKLSCRTGIKGELRFLEMRVDVLH